MRRPGLVVSKKPASPPGYTTDAIKTQDFPLIPPAHKNSRTMNTEQNTKMTPDPKTVRLQHNPENSRFQQGSGKITKTVRFQVPDNNNNISSQRYQIYPKEYYPSTGSQHEDCPSDECFPTTEHQIDEHQTDEHLIHDECISATEHPTDEHLMNNTSDTKSDPEPTKRNQNKTSRKNKPKPFSNCDINTKTTPPEEIHQHKGLDNELLQTTFIIQGSKFRTLIDSGAQKSFISDVKLKASSLQIKPIKLPENEQFYAKAFNGDLQLITDYVVCTLEHF